MRHLLLILGLTLTLPAINRADEAADIADLADPDGAALRRLKIGMTTPELLAVVKAATGADVPDADLMAGVADLGSANQTTREQAAKKLASWGPAAVPALRVAAGSAEAIVARQARELLDRISRENPRPALPSAVRVLLRQKDTAIIEPLVKLLPFVPDPELEADIWYGLDKHIKRDPALTKIIISHAADPMSARRALAGNVAARHGGDAGKTKAVALLADPAPIVRLRAAQGLLAAHDARGVPALIGLLVSEDNEVRWQAEELLRWTAPAGSPVGPVGNADAKGRAAAQAVWQAWWAKTGERVDFVAADATAHRPILMLTVHRESGRIALIGSDGAIRAEWPTLERLNDARYLPGGDVAAVQGTGPVNTGESRLSVSRPGGPAIWSHMDLENPVSCQLLPDGRLFVPEHPRAGVKTFRFQIYSPTGTALEQQPEWNDDNSTNAIGWMPGGRILCRDALSRQRPDEPELKFLLIFDPFNGKCVKVPAFTGVRYRLVSVELSSPAHYVIAGLDSPFSGYQDINIFDGIGREAWKHNLRSSRHAVSIRSGNLLICRGDNIMELTKDHRIVGEIVLRQNTDTARSCMPLVRLGFDTFPTGRDLIFDVEHYRQMLRSGNAAERHNALAYFAEISERPVQVLPEIKKCLTDSDAKIRTAAEKLLTTIDETRIPILLEQAKSDNLERRHAAFAELGQYGRAPGVLEALLAGLTDSNSQIRMDASGALGVCWPNWNLQHQRRVPARFAWAADRVLPALIVAASAPRQADDPSMKAQESAIYAIGHLGPSDARTAVEFLKKGVHGTPTLEYRCMQMLIEFGDLSPEVLPALKKELNQLNGRQSLAMSGMKRLGPKAASATDLILTAYDALNKLPVDQANPWRRMYLETLAAIAPADERVAKLMLSVLVDDNAPKSLRLIVGRELSQMPKTVARLAIAELEKWPNPNRRDDSGINQYDLIRDIRYRLAEPEE